MMKHFRICGASSCIEKTFAVVGAMVSIGALCYVLAKKCSICKDGCHCHGEIGDYAGEREVSMDLDIKPKSEDNAEA